MTFSITCGTESVEFSSLPESSQRYLAQKAANHLFANVLDSKVIAWTKNKENAGKEFTDEQKEAQKAIFAADTLTRLRNGEMEVRATTTRKTDEERWADEIALDMVRAIAKEKKVAMPDTKTDDGKAKLAAMLDKIKTAKADEIAKQVEARRKAKAKLAESAESVLDEFF